MTNNITLSDIFEKLHDNAGHIPVEELFRELTPFEAAEFTSTSTRWLEDRRKDGSGPPFIRRGNNQVRYRLYDLIRDQEGRLARSNAEAAIKLEKRGAASSAPPG